MRLIDADALIEDVRKNSVSYFADDFAREWVDKQPTVMPSARPKRKKGKWDERSVFETEDSDIAQMQSAKCSVCGKYHTTPYLYFFDDFNFCPNCGADMRQ